MEIDVTHENILVGSICLSGFFCPGFCNGYACRSAVSKRTALFLLYQVFLETWFIACTDIDVDRVWNVVHAIEYGENVLCIKSGR